MTSVLDLREASDRPTYALPPEAYFDPVWYEREQQELFGKTWSLVGHVSHLANAGDFVTKMVGPDPIVVVRTAHGDLRAYLNVCRHRGMVIECDTRGNCGNAMRCMYHGWEWDLDGSLERVPQRKTQFADVDTETLGLLPASVGVSQGFVFVHPDPRPSTSFDEWIGDYPTHTGDYPWDELVEIGSTRVPLRCNWKLYIENHIDWLHLWYLHEKSLNQYEHHTATYQTSGLHWWSAETLRDGETLYDPAGVRPMAGVSEQEQRTLRANLIFPNVPFATIGRVIQTYEVVPTGPETCELDIRSYGAPGGVVTEQARNEGLIILRDEDGTACERMQIAMHSSRFAVGPLAFEHERPIADFHRNLLTFLAP